MDFFTRCQRKCLWEILVAHDNAARDLSIPQAGEHVLVKGADGGVRTAKLLYWGPHNGGVKFLDSREESSRATRVPHSWISKAASAKILPYAGLSKRWADIAKHVGCPFGPKQAQHEIFELRRLLQKRRKVDPVTTSCESKGEVPLHEDSPSTTTPAQPKCTLLK
jgi:hypothetical protein